MPYQSTKTYGHEVGLSVCFRQWRADSHCHFLHGYALSVKLTFEAEELDQRNWVQDFGGLKEIKAWLRESFDHKTIVANDDPERENLRWLQLLGVADIIFMDAVGCEAFAKHIFDWVENWLIAQPTGSGGQQRRVLLAAVEVREHGANSALYVRPSEVDGMMVVQDQTQGSISQEILDAIQTSGPARINPL